MNPKLRVFTKQLLIVASLTGLGVIALMFTIPTIYISPALPYLLIFFTASTLISFYFIQKKMEASPSGFVTAFMANSIIRLLLYLIVIVAYAFNNKADAVNFIISFFIMYIIFTAFEAVFFLKSKK